MASRWRLLSFLHLAGLIFPYFFTLPTKHSSGALAPIYSRRAIEIVILLRTHGSNRTFFAVQGRCILNRHFAGRQGKAQMRHTEFTRNSTPPGGRWELVQAECNESLLQCERAYCTKTFRMKRYYKLQRKGEKSNSCKSHPSHRRRRCQDLLKNSERLHFAVRFFRFEISFL